MTFGEHLEQLRKALAKASAWVGVGLIFGLFLADDIVQYIQTPLKAALEEYALKRDLERIKSASGVPVPDNVAKELREKKIISEDVLVDPRDFGLELQPKPSSPTTPTPADSPAPTSAPASTAPASTAPASSTPVTSTGAAPSADKASEKKPAEPSKQPATTPATTSTIATAPVTEAAVKEAPAADALYQQSADEEMMKRLVPVRIWRKVSSKVETLNIQEGFMIWLKAALIAGIVFGSPGIFWHIWGFVAAGLYPHERKYVYVFLPMSLGLFLSGVSLAFFVIFRFVIEFLLEANASLGTDLSPRLNEYVSFALILPLGFGLAFQLPLVMVFLNRIGMFTVQNYLQQWKIAILVIAFLSMILTPGGDLYSMCGMGLPLIFLYFLGIALCKYLPMGRPMGADGYDPVA